MFRPQLEPAKQVSCAVVAESLKRRLPFSFPPPPTYARRTSTAGLHRMHVIDHAARSSCSTHTRLATPPTTLVALLWLPIRGCMSLTTLLGMADAQRVGFKGTKLRRCTFVFADTDIDTDLSATFPDLTGCMREEVQQPVSTLFCPILDV